MATSPSKRELIETIWRVLSTRRLPNNISISLTHSQFIHSNYQIAKDGTVITPEQLISAISTASILPTIPEKRKKLWVKLLLPYFIVNLSRHPCNIHLSHAPPRSTSKITILSRPHSLPLVSLLKK